MNFVNTSWTTITPILASIASVFIACVAAYIANQQKKNAKLQLNLNLYEKRFKIYNSLTTLLNSVIAIQIPSEGDAGLDRFIREVGNCHRIFWSDSREKIFLVDDELNAYIDSVDKQIKEYSLFFCNNPRPSAAPDFKSWYDNSMNQHNILMLELERVAKEFNRYLNFKNINTLI